MSYIDYYYYYFTLENNPIYYAGAILTASNFLVYSMMSLVYLFGKESMLSNLFIYGPIAGIITTSVRDKYSFTFVLSSTLALAHGVAHVVYPFLDEDIGVNHNIDVWQDQFLHLDQSVLFSSIFLNNSSLLFTVYSFAFMIGNLLNAILGYNCWGESCHDLYVWVSLLPALSSGLHFATGTLFQTTKETCTYGFAIQGCSSIITYFMFKGSDDILKTFARCRFFEIYFIAPHYVGFFHSRYIITKTLPNYDNMKNDEKFLRILGIYSNDITEDNMSLFNNYFYKPEIKEMEIGQRYKAD
jgi:hypothetical protein